MRVNWARGKSGLLLALRGAGAASARRELFATCGGELALPAYGGRVRFACSSRVVRVLLVMRAMMVTMAPAVTTVMIALLPDAMVR